VFPSPVDFYDVDALILGLGGLRFFPSLQSYDSMEKAFVWRFHFLPGGRFLLLVS